MQGVFLTINNMQKKNLIPALIVLGLICLTVLVYSPGLRGMFLFDDKPNIVDNQALVLEDYSVRSLVKASLSFSSTLKRPISMLSFALNIDLCGKTPFCFKVVNLAIHIICGLLVFIFSRLILLRYREAYQRALDERIILLTASAIALLWLLHPINLTSVLYVVQRMTSLSACFSLAGMILYIMGRNKLLTDTAGKGLVILAFFMTIPAVLSKENGILLPFFLLLIEIFFFQFQAADANRKLLKLAFLASIAAPVALIAGYIITHPEWLLNIYAYREFTLYERLLSEARVFWLYTGLIYLPSNQRLSLFHDYVDISRGLFDPITTLYSIIALAGLLIFILYSRKRWPLLSFGLLFFIVGHLVESTFMPLELVFEHRNYLPSIGLLLPLGYYLLNNRISVNTVNIRRIALVCMILLFGIVTNLRASQWGNPLLLVELEVRNNADSPRIHNLAGNVYSSMLKRVHQDEEERYYQKALDYFAKASQLDPVNTSGLASIHILKAREKYEHDAELFEEILERLKVKKITATDTVSIKQLVACVEKSTCRNDVVDVGKLGRTIDANPHDSGRYKAIAYGILGSYYWNNDIDKELALHYITKAAEGYKSSRKLNLNYAKILVAMGYYDKARPVIEKIEKDDFFNLRKSEISQLKFVINYHERQIE
ncbi:MAG: hypothetical protein U5P41_03975 [Gammaproteobacteria bacterium]|nr:hypothetical protein [Gammaproteobacteria bacterium]